MHVVQRLVPIELLEKKWVQVAGLLLHCVYITNIPHIIIDLFEILFTQLSSCCKDSTQIMKIQQFFFGCMRTFVTVYIFCFPQATQFLTPDRMEK